VLNYFVIATGIFKLEACNRAGNTDAPPLLRAARRPACGRG
jgi:hypothetical protein